MDCKKLVAITSDICEREVLQLFLTFSNGRMDQLQFGEFAKRTKLVEKTQFSATAANEIFGKFSRDMDGDGVMYINYCIFRFKILPTICEAKNDDLVRVVNKLCWFDYSRVNLPRKPEAKSEEAVAEHAKEKEATIKRTLSNPLSRASNVDEVDSAAIAIQRIARGRIAKKYVARERELKMSYAAPLTSKIKATVALLGTVDNDSAERTTENDCYTPPPARVTAEVGTDAPLLSPATKTETPSKSTQLTPIRDEYTRFDIKRATSCEFQVQSALPDTSQVIATPSKQFNPIVVQNGLDHIAEGFRHERIEYTPYRDSKRVKNDQNKNELNRMALEREIQKEKMQQTPERRIMEGSAECYSNMPSVDSSKCDSVQKLFLRFAPSGEMTMNGFVRFCYGTVLVPFNPPIDFTGQQARFVFRQVIAECFNPEKNTYIEGILFGKRVMFEIFWNLLLPAVADIKGMSAEEIVKYLTESVTEEQLRRIYSSHEGPPLVCLLSTEETMKSDCSSFKSQQARIFEEN